MKSIERAAFLGLCRKTWLASHVPTLDAKLVAERWDGNRAFFLGTVSGGDEQHSLTLWRLLVHADDAPRERFDVLLMVERRKLSELLR